MIPMVLPDGTSRFVGERKAMAVFALAQVKTFGLEGVQALPVVSLVVDSVEPVAGSMPCSFVLGGNETVHHLSMDYRAEVRLRTIFGVTYGRIDVTCRQIEWR